MTITRTSRAGTTTHPEQETREEVRLLPPYHVILDNDDFHSFEFVIAVLLKTLSCTTDRAIKLAWKAHSEDRAVIWTGSKEVAEFKVEQIRTFHETRERDGLKLGPLSCSIEPAPGS